MSRSLGVGSEKITMRYSGSSLTPRENRFCPDKSGLPYPHADLMGGRAWVAVPMNKSGRDSDGRETVSTPGPKDCASFVRFLTHQKLILIAGAEPFQIRRENWLVVSKLFYKPLFY